MTDTNVFHMARHPRLLQQNRHKADISRLSSNVRFGGTRMHCNVRFWTPKMG